MRVAAIGGGTGLSTLLRGLKRHVQPPPSSTPTSLGWERFPCTISDLAGIVTVSDDGGSSGRLRKDLNMLPPGDLRNCLVALSEDEHLLSRLFQYRFEAGQGLEGHSFGNLFLAGLADITGDFALAVKMSSQILATRGHLYPATTVDVTLSAQMDDGSIVYGETDITASHRRIVRLMIEPEAPRALPEAVEAIERADLITVGPGSLYTSLITNMLVAGIPEALASARGVRVYVCNLMTQANESLGLSASQHIERIYNHARAQIFDYALVNMAPISPTLRDRYAAEGAMPIEPDIARMESLGLQCIAGNFVFEGDVLRHNYDQVTDAVLQLAVEHAAGKHAQY
ncbi:MAG TPA: uridine diphosphate-N-acetylglucosamine-binding protein YvcK [Acidobacteriaceae bacterium]|nr:uridine diphosphate-N-acetylglucosamine-binding protein YvcK [Acidobacteriaceae bacterium]